MTIAAVGIFPLHLGDCRQEQATARLAWFLAGAYPGGSKRKRVARDFGVSEETAKGWLTGRVWPSHRNFVAMGGRWGGPFIEFVFGTMLTPSEMERRMRANEDRYLKIVQEGAEEHALGEAAFLMARMALEAARQNKGAPRTATAPGRDKAAEIARGNYRKLPLRGRE